MTIDFVTGEILPERGLSEIERAALAQHERIIAAGLQSFVEVGEALAAVRDRRLYRAEFGTFEAYCDAKWSLTKSRVNQVIESARVTTMVAKVAPEARPINERQARALTGLAPEVAADVMRKAHADTGGKVTAKAIEDARKMRDLASGAAPAVTPKPVPVKADGRKQGKYGPRRKHAAVLDALTTSLAGLVIGTSEVTALDGSVTSEEATRLTSDLSAQISELNRINRLLKERTK